MKNIPSTIVMAVAVAGAVASLAGAVASFMGWALG